MIGSVGLGSGPATQLERGRPAGGSCATDGEGHRGDGWRTAVKKLINKVDDVVRESLEGVAAAHRAC